MMLEKGIPVDMVGKEDKKDLKFCMYCKWRHGTTCKKVAGIINLADWCSDWKKKD